MNSALITRVAVIVGLVLAVTGAAALIPRAVGSDGNHQRAAGQGFVQPASSETLTAQLAALGDHLEEQPKDAAGWALLAQGYVEQARMTADAGLYAKAEQAIRTSLTQQPDDNAEAMAAGAALNSAQHNFRQALRLSRAALQINPLSTVALAIRTDALTELGHYPQARNSARQMDRLRPGLPATTRLAYQAELRGDTFEAKKYFRSAAQYSSGPDRAFALVHLADLTRTSGNVGRAELLYREALRNSPDDVPAKVGLARIHSSRGELARAISLMEPVASSAPLPEHVTYLGELLLAAGHPDNAHAQFDVVSGTAALAEEQGVNVDLELSTFLADHGNPRASLQIAQRSWRERQTVHTADALGWALHQVGRDQQALVKIRFATELGFAPASFLHHLGSIEASLGRTRSAVNHLAEALRADPGYSPWQRAQVERQLAELTAAL
jgi:tetratricopeptide (TPR) repeat protein